MIGTILSLLVFFNGHPVQCVVDTGATMTSVRASVLAPVAGQEQWGAQEFVGLANVPVNVTLMLVPNVGTEDLGWERAMIASVPDEALPVDCVLGVDLLGQQPVRIDWSGRRVVRA